MSKNRHPLAYLDYRPPPPARLIREFDARGAGATASELLRLAKLAVVSSRRRAQRLCCARARRPPKLSRALGSELSLRGSRAHGGDSRDEERLLAVGRNAEHVERIVRGWRCVDRIAEANETATRHQSRALHVYQDEDGMVVVRGRLTPETGAVLMQALAAARETLYPHPAAEARATTAKAEATDAKVYPFYVPAETSTLAEQQADALTLIAETALHHGLEPGAPAERYQVVVHVDAAVCRCRRARASVLDGGTRVCAETSQRLACDASRVVMRHTRTPIVGVGARRGRFRALRRALIIVIAAADSRAAGWPLVR